MVWKRGMRTKTPSRVVRFWKGRRGEECYSFLLNDVEKDALRGVIAGNVRGGVIKGMLCCSEISSWIEESWGMLGLNVGYVDVRQREGGVRKAAGVGIIITSPWRDPELP